MTWYDFLSVGERSENEGKDIENLCSADNNNFPLLCNLVEETKDANVIEL